MPKQPLLLEPDQAELLDELSKRLRIPKQVLLREAVSQMLAMRGYGVSDQVTQVRDALEQALPLAQKVANLTPGQKLWQDKAKKADDAIRTALDWFPDVKKGLQLKIEFPAQFVRYVRNVGVDFQAIVNGKVRECRISFEALRDHFGAENGQASDLARAYIANKEEIHRAAKRLLSGSNEDVVIGADDFE